MDIGSILIDILVVLVAAKIAAEIAERLGIPAVLGEIVAGILIGPSVIGWVHESDVLFVLGELGVILLLLQVGMEMDLAELGKVGRASMLVAVVGVAVPFGLGFAAGVALGHDAKTSVFLGAALTATSVGITARVFGDLGALSTVEARVVLGAAVADDVLGLVILTVVTRVVTGEGVSVWGVLSVILVAVGFLFVTGVLGIALTPKLFAFVTRSSRSPATIVAFAFAFTLAFAVLANSAKLAPIIGAFVAGLAMGRTDQAERIHRELSSVGHLFIPVFFLSIGINTDLHSMFQPSVLGLAGALLVVAIIGKLASPIGAVGTRADKLLIGIGMIPRGEVGLIFASLGLVNGVLNDDLYAALILVVLATTVITPPLLRVRVNQVAAVTEATRPAATERPAGGWLRNDGGRILLSGYPPDSEALSLALQAARQATDARPGTRLLDWFAEHRSTPLVWDRDATTDFLRLLRDGNARSWRLLDTLGVLERALPALAGALDRRRNDPSELDPVRAMRWSLVDRLHEMSEDEGDRRFVGEYALLQNPNPLALAALTLDIADPLGADTTEVARGLLARLDLPDGVEREVAFLVTESGMLRAAVRDPDSFDEQTVLELATHLGSHERARSLYLLSLVLGELPEWQRDALDELHRLVMQALNDPTLTGPDAGTLADARRRAALALVESSIARDRIFHAPRSYLLTHEPAELARHADLVEPVPQARVARVAINPNGAQGRWKVDIACRDRTGLLARLTGGLTEVGLDIESASIATWADGAVLDTFTVRAETRPAAEHVAAVVEQALMRYVPPSALPDIELVFDNEALPWHTACHATGPDRPGLLQALSAAFATANVQVHSARVSTTDGTASDRFSLSDKYGRKLDQQRIDDVRRVLAGQKVRSGRRLGRR